MDIDRGIEKSNQVEKTTTLVGMTPTLSAMLEAAIEKAGSPAKLAAALGVNRQNVWCWQTRGKISTMGRVLLVKYLMK